MGESFLLVEGMVDEEKLVFSLECQTNSAR